MGLRWQDWPPQVLATLRRGAVIPAHPLALDAARKLDAPRQRALTRYYLDAGAGGLAVGVHTTQFAIREAGLYRPVLELAMRSAAEWAGAQPIMIAGLATMSPELRTPPSAMIGTSWPASACTAS